jgi:hypothetical protein
LKGQVRASYRENRLTRTWSSAPGEQLSLEAVEPAVRTHLSGRSPNPYFEIGDSCRMNILECYRIRSCSGGAHAGAQWGVHRPVPAGVTVASHRRRCPLGAVAAATAQQHEAARSGRPAPPSRSPGGAARGACVAGRARVPGGHAQFLALSAPRRPSFKLPLADGGKPRLRFTSVTGCRRGAAARAGVPLEVPPHRTERAWAGPGQPGQPSLTCCSDVPLAPAPIL